MTTNKSIAEKPTVIKEKIWYYLSLEVYPDPVVLGDSSIQTLFDQIDISTPIWHTLLMSCLNKMYGLIGEASPFDIMAKKTSKAIILRIQYEDIEKFSNSILAYTFNLNRYSDLDLNCNVRITKKGEQIGLVV